MDKFAGAVIVIALIAAALSLMFISWQRRRRRDVSLATVRDGNNSEVRVLEVGCFYVSTTPRSEPLERLAIPGLAFRARANVGLSRAGVAIEPRGEIDTFIPASQLRGVRAADATIDRSAGRGSLTALDWTAANGVEITSFLRIPNRLDRSLFIETVKTFLPPSNVKEPLS
jgi:hypothetical protein